MTARAWGLVDEAVAEARETVRDVGRRLRRRAGSRAALELKVADLEEAVRTLAKFGQDEAKRLRMVRAELDELIGVVGATASWAVDVELADLLAHDPLGTRAEGLAAARELRARANTAKAAADLGQARDGIALMLGHRVESSSDDAQPAEAIEYALTELEVDTAKTASSRIRLVIPELEFDEEASPSYVVSYLRDRLDDLVEAPE